MKKFMPCFVFGNCICIADMNELDEIALIFKSGGVYVF